MRFIKLKFCKNFELCFLFLVYFVLLVNFLVFKDSVPALLSAFFGITYTVLAGKGNPICYLFGLSGSGFYIYLSYNNFLWGNLILYLFYYVPMQILGFFKWKMNLKRGKFEIKKSQLDKKTFFNLLIISTISSILFSFILIYLKDKNPFFDAITTIFSITGMYLTVKRCIEQWIFWMIVNGLSAIMWINIALGGEKVYSTIIMWSVYFFLAIYFYFSWKRELLNN